MRIDPESLPWPNEPYRGFLPFRLLDWRIFFERDLETEKLVNLVSMYRGVLLIGQSGVGKSSLLNAGLIPHALQCGRSPERVRVFPKQGTELLVERIRLREARTTAAVGEEPKSYLPSRFSQNDDDERISLSCDQFLVCLKASTAQSSTLPFDSGPPLLIFDQFEELVTLFEENPNDQDRYDEAQAARIKIEGLLIKLLVSEPIPVKIVFAFRDDYLARLTPFFSAVSNLIDQRVILTSPKMECVTKIVRGPFVQQESREGGRERHFHDELSEDLAAKMTAGIRKRYGSSSLHLPEVQTLCLALWRQPKLRAALLRADDPAGILQTILESEALRALDKLMPWDRVISVALLTNLVAREGARNVLHEEKLINETRRNPLMWIFSTSFLETLLERLSTEIGLLRRSRSSGTPYYELTSEFLIPWLQKRRRQFRNCALIIWGFCSVLILLVLMEMVYLGHRTKQEKDKAFAAKKDADELIDFLQYELSPTLGQLGRKDLMGIVNGRIRRFHKDHPPESRDLTAIRKNAEALLNNGGSLRDAGRNQAALEEYYRALALYQGLLTQEPEKSDRKRDLSVCYERIGDVLRDQNDLPGALKNYDDSLAISENLAKQDPNNRRLQADLAIGWARVGYLQTNLTIALKNYEDSLSIWKMLLTQIPDDPECNDGLSECYDRIGDNYLESTNLVLALKNYTNSLSIRETLANLSPANPERQRALSVSYYKIAEVLNLQGDYEGALQNYKNDLAIAEKLTKSVPMEVQYWTDLATSYWKTGEALLMTRPESKDAAREMIEEARAILMDLDQHLEFNPMRFELLGRIGEAIEQIDLFLPSMPK